MCRKRLAHRIGYGKAVRKSRPTLFRGRHFQDHVIVLCVRWYLRYCLTLRDLEELMTERGLAVDHSTIGGWVLRYAPELNKRVRREIRPPNRSWRVDETYVRVAGVLDLSIPSGRFHRRDHRLHAIAQTGCNRRQALLADGVVAGRPDPATCHQC